MKLKEKFKKQIAPELKKSLGIKNVNAVPTLKKVVINAGLGHFYTSGTKDFSEFIDNVKTITGQKPVVTKAKKAISNFKTRIGMPSGVRVTLRGERMWDFVNKLVNVVMPRIRDFRGISKKAFDGKGNYSFGIKEHLVFPEINPDDIVKIHGLQVCIETSAKNNEHGLALLTALGFPFKKD
ncbi:50S ribosomal protein L5 [Candidatus Peregrinibacteria bacterium]|nr:50S ribosomal protein L5 [Candidatus Peregrinibacteria bacterium]